MAWMELSPDSPPSASGVGRLAFRRLPRSAALAVLSALACVLVLHASPASAAGAHERILESAPFSQPLSFSHPTGVAVDQETGNVFVADNGADAVDIFGAEGGTPAGGVPVQITGIEFANEEPQAVAVDNACYYQKLSGSACEAADPANGDVYVTEQEGHAVSRFKFESKTKKYKKEAFYKVLSSELQGVAVDTDGNVYIANHTETPILVFNPSGTEVGKIEQKKVAHPSHVAVGAPGVVYVSPAEGGIVIKLGVNSKYEIGLGQETVLESASGGDMAVDSHGTLYLDGDGTSISVYDSAGTLTEGFGSGDFAESQGVAVNDTSNNVYVSNVGEGNLEVFGASATEFPLTVTKAGTGTGTVECKVGAGALGACAAKYPEGTKVTLTATAAAGSTFAGWSEAGCSGTGSCEVTMSAAMKVTATFTKAATEFPLTVTKAGTGTGTVECKVGAGALGACAAKYPEGTKVTLTATAAAGSTFAGWSEAGCSGTGSCEVTMSAAMKVTATFTKAATEFPLTVTKAG